MSRDKKILVMIFVVLGVILILYTYFYQTVSIRYELSYKQKNVKEAELDLPYLVADNIEDLNYVLYKWLQDSLVNKTKVNFADNDYLVTFGYPIKDAIYYTHMNNPRDGCGYLTKLPLTITFQQAYTDTIYFYRIEKGKYRHLCP